MSVCLGSMHSICISQCIRWSPCTNWTGWGRKGGGAAGKQEEGGREGGGDDDDDRNLPTLSRHTLATLISAHLPATLTVQQPGPHHHQAQTPLPLPLLSSSYDTALRDGGGGSLPGPCLYASMWHMPYSPSLSLYLSPPLLFVSCTLVYIRVRNVSLSPSYFTFFSRIFLWSVWRSPLSGENLAQPTSKILKIQNVGQVFLVPWIRDWNERNHIFFSLNKYFRSKL